MAADEVLLLPVVRGVLPLGIVLLQNRILWLLCRTVSEVTVCLLLHDSPLLPGPRHPPATGQNGIISLPTLLLVPLSHFAA